MRIFVNNDKEEKKMKRNFKRVVAGALAVATAFALVLTSSVDADAKKNKKKAKKTESSADANTKKKDKKPAAPELDLGHPLISSIFDFLLFSAVYSTWDLINKSRYKFQINQQPQTRHVYRKPVTTTSSFAKEPAFLKKRYEAYCVNQHASCLPTFYQGLFLLFSSTIGNLRSPRETAPIKASIAS